MVFHLCLVLSALLFSGAHGVTNPCSDPAVSSFPFCNHNLDLVSRVKDLIARMETKDKIAQLGNGAPGIDSLKIPPYQWWSEALHGVANSPGVHFGGNAPVATSFPQVIGLGATFNMSLVRAMAEVISTEARAMYNVGQAGLNFFAPNINIFRDPRWGRGQETPGEDPHLTSQYAIQFAKGMQEGEDTRYIKAAVCCKHFAAYGEWTKCCLLWTNNNFLEKKITYFTPAIKDLENWNGTDRFHFNAIVSDQDFIETYFPAFEACIREGRGASIMCSLNAVNGVPSCANDLIQNKIVRDQWGFQGFFVSDCGAIDMIMNGHHYTNTTEDTVAAALKGGTDLNCGKFYQAHGQDAYDKKKITDEDLDHAVGRLFYYRMALGMFDPPEDQPYCNISTDQINTTAHQELALQAARESIVLLQNDGALPLDISKKVALIGPDANVTKTMKGNYYGNSPYIINPLMGLQTLGVSVTYEPGCDIRCASDSGFADAVNAAKAGDVVIAVVGLDQYLENEGHDRTDIGLPGDQDKLLQTIKQAISSTTPMIVVVMSGGPVDISSAKSVANGILWVGYPGQSGGQAIAEVLYGEVNPSGRLPFTIYPADYVNQISFFDMSLRSSPGRTYKFYTGTAVYEFGTGLSYTQFSYKWSSLPQNTLENKPLNMTFKQLQLGDINYEAEVTNTGKIGGATSVLAYITSSVPGAPIKELFSFQKVYLDPGETKKLFFSATSDTFKVVNQQGKKLLYPGRYVIQIGDLTHNITLKDI